MLRQMFALVRSWWRWLRRRSRYTALHVVRSMDEVPAKPGAELFLVERGGIARWVALECPCRCGERIEVNLMESREPRWILAKNGSRICLQPSLWMPANRCGSHFFIKNNRVIWV